MKGLMNAQKSGNEPTKCLMIAQNTDTVDLTLFSDQTQVRVRSSLFRMKRAKGGSDSVFEQVC